jgi:hypothetical protein
MMRGVAAIAAVAILIVTLAVVPTFGDHEAGILVRDYVPENSAEAAILQLVRTVAEGWGCCPVRRPDPPHLHRQQLCPPGDKPEIPWLGAGPLLPGLLDVCPPGGPLVANQVRLRTTASVRSPLIVVQDHVQRRKLTLIRPAASGSWMSMSTAMTAPMAW